MHWRLEHPCPFILETLQESKHMHIFWPRNPLLGWHLRGVLRRTCSEICWRRSQRCCLDKWEIIPCRSQASGRACWCIHTAEHLTVVKVPSSRMHQWDWISNTLASEINASHRGVNKYGTRKIWSVEHTQMLKQCRNAWTWCTIVIRLYL